MQKQYEIFLQTSDTCVNSEIPQAIAYPENNLPSRYSEWRSIAARYSALTNKQLVMLTTPLDTYLQNRNEEDLPEPNILLKLPFYNEIWLKMNPDFYINILREIPEKNLNFYKLWEIYEAACQYFNSPENKNKLNRYSEMSSDDILNHLRSLLMRANINLTSIPDFMFDSKDPFALHLVTQKMIKSSEERKTFLNYRCPTVPKKISNIVETIKTCMITPSNSEELVYKFLFFSLLKLHTMRHKYPFDEDVLNYSTDKIEELVQFIIDNHDQIRTEEFQKTWKSNLDTLKNQIELQIQSDLNSCTNANLALNVIFFIPLFLHNLLSLLCGKPCKLFNFFEEKHKLSASVSEQIDDMDFNKNKLLQASPCQKRR